VGRPSPNKKFWVIFIQGSYVRIEGLIPNLPKGCPTPFASSKAAENASRSIWVDELHFVHLVAVTRKWLESVAKKEIEAKVQSYASVNL